MLEICIILILRKIYIEYWFKLHISIWDSLYDFNNQTSVYSHLSLSLSLSQLSFLIFWNVPHAYVDNIQINMDDRRNGTLLIISRVRLPWESDKCIILIGLCCVLWVLWSLNKNRKTICERKTIFWLERERKYISFDVMLSKLF